MMNTTSKDHELVTQSGHVAGDMWIPPEFDATLDTIVLAAVLVILDLVTILGNGLVLLAFALNRSLFQPFNMFIFNLAVTDFLVAITAMTFYTIDTLLGYWPFGYIMCALWIFFDFAMTFASVFTLVAISVDRYWCVTWAIHYKIHNNRRKTAAILAAVWLLVLLIWTPPLIADRLKHREEHVCIWEPSDNKEYVIFIAVIGHYLPCLIMVFCYLKVLYVMRRQTIRVEAHHTRSLRADTSRQSDNPGTSHNPSITRSSHAPSALSTNPTADRAPNPSTGETDFTTRQSVTGVTLRPGVSGQTDFTRRSVTDVTLRPGISGQARSTGIRNSSGEGSRNSTNYKRDKKIFITLTYVLGSYLICWFPFYIAFDASAWKPELVPNQLYTFFFWMTYVNSTLNPIIYAYTSKDFRTAFLKTLKCLFRCKVQ